MIDDLYLLVGIFDKASKIELREEENEKTLVEIFGLMGESIIDGHMGDKT